MSWPYFRNSVIRFYFLERPILRRHNLISALCRTVKGALISLHPKLIFSAKVANERRYCFGSCCGAVMVTSVQCRKMQCVIWSNLIYRLSLHSSHGFGFITTTCEYSGVELESTETCSMYKLMIKNFSVIS